MLAGKLVNLWSIESFDLALTREWLLDPELVSLSALSPYLSSSFELEQWHQRLLNDPLLKVFAIKTKDGLHIGNIELSGWDMRARSAEIGLFTAEMLSIQFQLFLSWSLIYTAYLRELHLLMRMA